MTELHTKSPGARYRPARKTMMIPGLLFLVALSLVAAWKYADFEQPSTSLQSATSLQDVDAGLAFGKRTPSEPASPLSSETLIGRGDAAPVLISGGFAEAPAGDSKLLPTIVCRVLVDSTGMVQEARLFKRRPQLSSFEAVALEAVRSYAFRPGLKAGEPVAVWVNVPVPFLSRNPKERSLVRVKGSDTIGGALAPALGLAHERRGGGKVEVEALGSSTAFRALFDGSAEIGASSRPISASELERASELGLQLEEFALGFDGVALIVHPDNPVKSLSLQQAAAAFRGEVDNWRDVGGEDRPMMLLGRPTYSGTHQFVRDRLVRLDGAKPAADFAPSTEFIERNEDIIARVMGEPSALAYVGLGWADTRVRALALKDGAAAPVLPSKESVADGSYPIYRRLLLYTRGQPTPETADFLRFAFSKEGQDIVRSHGFIGNEQPVVIAQVDAPLRAESPAPEVVRVQFGSAAIRLDSAALSSLDALIPRLRAGDVRALVVGAADSTGSARDNAMLARRRAQYVRDYFIKGGVPGSAVHIDSAGQAQPLASNDSEEGRRENRRVDIYLVRSP